MESLIRDQLSAWVDEDYRKFSAALIPTITNVMGVRLPELRKLARRIARSDWRAYLAQAEDDFFEETMLQGMVIGYAKMEIDERLLYIAQFVPKIDNWSVCDSFCSGLKMTASHPETMWLFLQPYLRSDKEFELRYGVVMLLNYYVSELYIQEVLDRLNRIRHEGYYVKMAVAWAISICFIKLPEPTMALLQNNSLDDFTYNKALAKITESLRVDPETKKRIRSMRRSVTVCEV
ncbi:DNA alkylation repair protein [Gorillibacterium timonense]|uniref:DNA alkylation repair protein n=1 Tax=Gorillibacterium timonense TaxID=1689269 RepID=UPI00071DBB6F|nr:DNA alkylation repair protein [Gorillibacterium timonense]